MLTTVLFDMGGTLEDIWYNKETQQEAARKLLEILRDHHFIVWKNAGEKAK